MTTARLTVSESKRLIAKGIAANKDVKDRLENGIVIITLGTTNTYLAEELAGLSAPRGVSSQDESSRVRKKILLEG